MINKNRVLKYLGCNYSEEYLTIIFENYENGWARIVGKMSWRYSNRDQGFNKVNWNPFNFLVRQKDIAPPATVFLW